MVGKVQTTFIKQSKRAVVNLDLELGLARFSNLELDLEFKTDFQSCTGLVDGPMRRELWHVGHLGYLP